MERHRLSKLVARRKAPLVMVQRARMILMLSAGHGPSRVARLIGVSDRVVRKWRARWEQSPRLEALDDAPRSGRPPTIGLATRCEVVKLACDRPDESRAPFHVVWTQQAIADALAASGGIRISRSSIQRILSARGLRPHRVRQWLHSPDPQFREKVDRVCQLYMHPPKGSIVLCVDEKPIQVLRRRYPTRVGPRAVVRREFEYRRGGTCCLLGAYDVATGHVHGRIVKRRDAAALISFLDDVVRRYPDRTIYVVWDNLNLHLDGRDGRWTRFTQRHGGRVRFVHTPLHASWVNQIEIWFSILQRRVIRYGSFEDLRALRATVLGFVRHWNAKLAHPFRWTFSGRFDQTARAA